MLQEEYEVYRPYSFQPPSSSPASVGVLDDAPVTQTPGEQIAFQPPRYPAGPHASPTPPRKRPGRAGVFVLLTLVLVLIFGVGLFAGWEFTSSSRSSTSITSKAAATTAATSSSVTTLETLQEAAIAKIEPAVVELQVTTAQGQQIGSGVIIDSNGDIVTNNHVVSGEQSIQVLLSNGKTEQGQLIGTNAADDLAVVRIAPFAHMTVAQL